MRNNLTPTPDTADDQGYPLRRIAEELPELDGDTAWILRYAQFRSSWADQAIKSVIDRAAAMLRGVGLIAAAGWTVFLWGRPAGFPSPAAALTTAALAAAAFAVSLGACLAVLCPGDRTPPRDEHTAFVCACDHEPGVDASAKFAAFLAETTEDRLNVANRKGNALRTAFVAAAAGAAILLAGLAVQGATAYRSGKPFSRAAAQAPRAGSSPAAPAPPLPQIAPMGSAPGAGSSHRP